MENIVNFTAHAVRFKTDMEKSVRKLLIGGGNSNELIDFVLARLKEDMEEMDCSFNVDLPAECAAAVKCLVINYREQIGTLLRRLAIAHMNSFQEDY